MQRLNTPAPIRPSCYLVVRHLCRQSALLTDRDGLPHRLDDASALIADVRLVVAAKTAGDLGKLDELGERRESAGHVHQARAQPEGPVAHTPLDKHPHLVELL